MKFLLFSLFSIVISIVSVGQDDYIETEFSVLLSNGKNAKKFTVTILTSDEVAFIINAKKKVTFQLPVGEKFLLTTNTRGYEPSEIEVDLRDVPSEKRLADGPSLTIKSKVYRIPGKNEELRYYYSSRYGKMIGQIVSK